MPYHYSTYLIDTSPFCPFCHYSCYYCTTNLSTACSSCNTTHDYRIFIASNNTCTCINGYYDVGVPKCTKCQYSCATCTNGSSCSSCNATLGRTFDNTSTFCGCDHGLYDNKLN